MWWGSEINLSVSEYLRAVRRILSPWILHQLNIKTVPRRPSTVWSLCNRFNQTVFSYLLQLNHVKGEILSKARAMVINIVESLVWKQGFGADPAAGQLVPKRLFDNCGFFFFGFTEIDCDICIPSRSMLRIRRLTWKPMDWPSAGIPSQSWSPKGCQ